MTTLYSLKFLNAVGTVLGHEGGYVDNPDDPGGQTNWGISQRSYPNVDIANLTKDGATAIYYNDFWVPNRYDSIKNDSVVNNLFDMAINAGQRTSIKLAQQTINTYKPELLTVDGLVGPATLDAVNDFSADDFLRLFKVLRAQYYLDLVAKRPTNLVFLKGWLRRAASC